MNEKERIFCTFWKNFENGKFLCSQLNQKIKILLRIMIYVCTAKIFSPCFILIHRQK